MESFKHKTAAQRNYRAAVFYEFVIFLDGSRHL